MKFFVVSLFALLVCASAMPADTTSGGMGGMDMIPNMFMSMYQYFLRTRKIFE